jgi:hypothetical protein
MKKIQGGCLCGKIEYSFNNAPNLCGHCHCNDCRRQTGASVATFAIFKRRDLNVGQGTLKSFSSSPGVTRYFCDACGTPIAYHSKDYDDEIHIHIGTLNSPESHTPQFHVYCKDQLPWLTISDETPRFDGIPRKADSD